MKNSIVFLGIILFVFGCKNKDNIEQIEDSIIPITVCKSVEKEYVPQLEYSGTAFANKEANLGTAIPGRVEKIYFDKGQEVNAGDLIVELSSELYTQALIEKNTLQKDFERVSRLREKGSLSEQDFDHVKAQYEASVAKTQMMKKNAEIRAPFKGTIVEHIVKEGENYLFAPSFNAGYSMTSGIVKLMQLDILNIEIDVNEKDISKIKRGQKAKVIFDAYPDKEFVGHIAGLDPILSTVSRTAKAQVVIENKELLIKPGMFARVSLELSKEKSVFVPIQSIFRQTGTGSDFVFLIENNIATKIPILRKYTLKDFVAVEGIDANKTIAVAGNNKLMDGSKVLISKE